MKPARRVLVVEDEYFVAQELAKALEGQCYDVVGPVPSCEQALEALAADRAIDLVILDIHLRGEAVYPVADALMERKIPFVFATGYDAAAIPAKYLAAARWEKPFDEVALAAALAQLLP